MKSSTLKVGAGIVSAVAVVFVIAQWGSRQSEQPTETQPPTAAEPMKRSDRVRQRLEELRAVRPGSSRESAPEGRIGVAARVQPAPQRTMPFKPHPLSSAPGGKPSSGQAAGKAPNAKPERASEAPAEMDDDDIEDIPTLKTLALQDPDPDRRLSAINMLGATEDPQAIPILVQALSDQDEEVRMAALEELSDFTDEPPVDAIENAINDPSADIRFEAVSVLSDIGGDAARGAIEKALNDPDEDVRALAEGILDMEDTYEGTEDAAHPNQPPTPGQQPAGAMQPPGD